MIVAELRIIPVGEASSMEEPLERVVEALDETGLDYIVGPLATSIEAESLDEILDAVKRAHEALVDEVPRIITQLTIDHRLDKQESLESLVEVGL